MRRTTGILVAGALVVTGCGGSAGGVTTTSPAAPINLTVYINDSRVSLSPETVGAGSVVFIITNQASSAKSLTLLAADAAGQRIASTPSISPQGTAQVTVDLSTQGDYSLTTDVNGSTGAPPGTTPVQPATLHIGPPRPNGSSDLLQP